MSFLSLSSYSQRLRSLRFYSRDNHEDILVAHWNYCDPVFPGSEFVFGRDFDCRIKQQKLSQIGDHPVMLLKCVSSKVFISDDKFSSCQPELLATFKLASKFGAEATYDDFSKEKFLMTNKR